MASILRVGQTRDGRGRSGHRGGVPPTTATRQAGATRRSRCATSGSPTRSPRLPPSRAWQHTRASAT
eukprot:2070535-Pyramimonas_sp.AAC.1